MHPMDGYGDESIDKYERDSPVPKNDPRSSTPASRGLAQTPASNGDSRRQREQKENEVVLILCDVQYCVVCVSYTFYII